MSLLACLRWIAAIALTVMAYGAAVYGIGVAAGVLVRWLTDEAGQSKYHPRPEYRP